MDYSKLPVPIFEDKCVVENVDNMKFENVSRLRCRSEAFEAVIDLDVRDDLFKVEQNDRFNLALTTKVTNSVHDTDTLLSGNTASLMDDVDYAMYGVVFRIEDKGPNTRLVYISFGGLLMCMSTDPASLKGFNTDARLYLLLTK